MSTCKFYKSGWVNHFCTRRGKEEQVPESHVRSYCNGWAANYDKCPAYRVVTDGSGCYISSACAAARGLADDCRELTALRQFRDGWLKRQPFGAAAIAQYYAAAPEIVLKIDARSDRALVYEKMYTDYIRPCVALINSGNHQKAYEHYTLMVDMLVSEYV